jgi:hypothetical protein
MKQQIVEELKKLLEEESVENTAPKAKELRSQYLKLIAAEQKEKKQQLSEEDTEEEFQPQRDLVDEEFDKVWTLVSKRQLEWEKSKKAEQEKNYERKQAIISEIQSLTQNEENIKNAFEKMKELESEWKSIREIPQDKARKLQSEYSKVRDEFYYNIRIHKELLEHDLKKNLQLKQEVVDKIKALSDVEQIKEIESLIKAYTAEWDEIGPTFREKWELIRDDYRSAVRATYDRIKNHYKQLKELQLTNLEKKEKLVNQLEQVVNLEITKDKKWRKFTDEVKAIQKEWKQIGFVPKEHNDIIWKKFKELGDLFFERKKEFYAELKREQDENKRQKLEIIREVDEIKESGDISKESSHKIKQLQKRWQKIGSCHQRDEQRLWRQFRAACNHFFEQQKEELEAKDKEQEENLKKKEDFIEQLKAVELTGDKNADKEKIDALASEFHKVGFVPRDKKNEVNNTFNNALDEKYSALGLSREQKTKAKFEQKLEEIKAVDNPDRIIQAEERKLNDEIRKLEATIQQYENNLGFFGHSKGAQKLKQEVENKIDRSKEKVNSLKQKRKMLRNL